MRSWLVVRGFLARQFRVLIGRWSFIDGAVTLISLAIVVSTLYLTWAQVDSLKESNRASQARQLSELASAFGNDKSSARIAASYAVVDYSRSFPDSRTEAIQLLAAQIKNLPTLRATKTSARSSGITLPEPSLDSL